MDLTHSHLSTDCLGSDTRDRSPASSIRFDIRVGALPHGSRLRYVRGCRCDECRSAHAQYLRGRRRAKEEGNWNGFVPAEKARLHLQKLSSLGVGVRAVSAATDISKATIEELKSGRQKHIRALSERKILAVTLDMASDFAHIDAAPSKALIRELEEAGFTLAQIGEAIHPGMRVSRLLSADQKQITAVGARRVRVAFERLMSAGERRVSARKTRKRLEELLEEQYPAKRLAQWLQMPDGQLVLPDAAQTISQDFERRVHELYIRLTT